MSSLLQVEGLLGQKFTALLKALQHEVKSQPVLLLPSERGLQLSTDYLRTLQSHLYLERAFFRSWNWRTPARDDTQTSEADASCFALPLAQLIQALELCKPSTIPGKRDKDDDARLYKIEWSSSVDKVSIKMQDTPFDMLIECNVATVTIPEIPSVVFADEENPVILKVICPGESMREWLIQLASDARMTIEADPTIPVLTLSTEDQGSRKQVLIPTDCEQIESYSCVVPICTTFPTVFIQRALYALAQASKVSLKINSRGALSMQMMVPIATGTVYLEHIQAPLVEI